MFKEYICKYKIELQMKTTLLLFSAFLLSFMGYAQDSKPPSSVRGGTYKGKSIPFKDFKKVKQRKSGKSDYKIFPNNFPVNDYESPNSLPVGGDPIRQAEVNMASQSRNLQISFDGPDSSFSGSVPPDPSGAVGPNHYVSAINDVATVYDKQGNILAGPTSLGSFIGDGQDSGDPIVMYDQLADRWFVSQFNVPANGLSIAISETSDPTGSYFLYEFLLDAFPDYPHYSVWHDAYYLTVNKGGENIFALERDKMLAGESNPQMQGFILPEIIVNPNTIFSPEPAYLLGKDFDPETPGYITYLQDDGWGAEFDHLKVWELDIDFETPTNSTVSTPLEIPVAPFDSFIAPFGVGELSQPGTTMRLDMLTGIISYAAHYRPFEDHNSWLVTFNVDVQEDNTTAGVRWVELRNNDTDDWSVYQEGTYAPADGNSRFMGSGAIDAQGNIGLAFNVGGPNTPVGVSYTGRFADDPLGIMTVAEEIIVEGIGVQTTTNRFGDYSQISLDPDNFTFWHTAQYFTSNNFWTTRIGAFNLSNGFDNDMGVIAINTPTDGTLTDNETVEIVIRNFGTQDVVNENIIVELRLDNVLVSSENFIANILAGETTVFTFTPTVDLSIVNQTYLLEATTIFAADEFSPNDDLSKEVRHLFPNDLGITRITSPESGFELTDEEEVTFRIVNFGADSQSNFDITLDLNGTIFTETVTETINSQEILEYTFTQAIDFSNPQAHVLTVTTALEGDQDTSNDATTIIINNVFCQPESDCDEDDGVTQITLVNQSIAVDCGSTSEGYSDNTNIIFDFVLTENPFNGVLQVGFADSEYALWIDFNDNNVFEQDEVVSNELVESANTDFEFTIDLDDFPNATEGNHLMRLRGEDESSDGNVLVSCEDLEFGRTNDFTANITAFLNVEEQQINRGDLLVSTLDNNNFNIQLNTEFDESLFMGVFNTSGQQLTYKPVAKIEGGYRINLDMSSMPSGVYFIRLGSSNPSTFKTAKIVVR